MANEKSEEKTASRSARVLGTLSIVFGSTLVFSLAGVVTGILARCKSKNRQEKKRGTIGLCLSVAASCAIAGMLSYAIVSARSDAPYRAFFLIPETGEGEGHEVDEAGFLSAFDPANSPDLTITSRRQFFLGDAQFSRAHYQGTKAAYEEAASDGSSFNEVGFALLKDKRLYRYRQDASGAYNSKADPALTGWSYPFLSLREGMFDLPDHRKEDLASFYQSCHYDQTSHYYVAQESISTGEHFREGYDCQAEFSLYFSSSRLRDLRVFYRYENSGSTVRFCQQFLFTDYGAVSLAVPASFPVQP
jgi:hypothetical protein